MSLTQRKNACHSKEFKDHAIKLARTPEISVAQTARYLGIKSNTLYNWLSKENSQDRIMQKPNTKNVEPLKLSPDLIAENKRLQKELKQAKTDLEILKKATAYFSNLPE